MLNRDERWSIFEGIPEQYEPFAIRMTEEIYIKPQVNQHVHNSFRIIKRLLELSYFEYELVDVAANKAVMTLEMACRIRYEELTNEKWGSKKPLAQLIKWLFNGGYLEVYDDFYLEHVRWIRNSIAHPDHYGFAGPSMRQWIMHPMDMINDLYENPHLRKERLAYTRNWYERMAAFTKEGAVVTLPDGVRMIVFKATFVFSNNKVTPTVNTIVFHPIFEIPENWEDKDGRHAFSPLQMLQVERVGEIGGQINGYNGETMVFSLSGVLNEVNRNRFSEFTSRFEKYNEHQLYERGLESAIGDLYDSERRSFHKMN